LSEDLRQPRDDLMILNRAVNLLTDARRGQIVVTADDDPLIASVFDPIAVSSADQRVLDGVLDVIISLIIERSRDPGELSAMSDLRRVLDVVERDHASVLLRGGLARYADAMQVRVADGADRVPPHVDDVAHEEAGDFTEWLGPDRAQIERIRTMETAAGLTRPTTAEGDPSSRLTRRVRRVRSFSADDRAAFAASVRLLRDRWSDRAQQAQHKVPFVEPLL
ncbi:MAG: hypothetical protein ACOC0P_03645, partial [Planctomycetota bacterium]